MPACTLIYSIVEPAACPGEQVTNKPTSLRAVVVNGIINLSEEGPLMSISLMVGDQQGTPQPFEEKDVEKVYIEAGGASTRDIAFKVEEKRTTKQFKIGPDARLPAIMQKMAEQKAAALVVVHNGMETRIPVDFTKTIESRQGAMQRADASPKLDELSGCLSKF